MARSRNIKPGLFDNEILGEADPIYTVLFAGLWTLADREGRLEDRPARIKKNILGYRDVDPFKLLAWLDDESFIKRYSVNGEKYIQILKWKKHQNPHHKEVSSVIPEVPKCNLNGKTDQKQQDSHTQSMHESSMSHEQVMENASCPTDSLNLIPDSLNLIPSSECQPSVNQLRPRLVEVFEFWRNAMEKSGTTKLDSKRKSKIEQRLRDGYTVEQIKRAIINCSKTPHNMGQNDRGQKYNDIELICRDAANLERFMESNPDQAAGQVHSIQQDDTSWGSNIQHAYIPNQQKVLGNE